MGSEMCIRDSWHTTQQRSKALCCSTAFTRGQYMIASCRLAVVIGIRIQFPSVNLPLLDCLNVVCQVRKQIYKGIPDSLRGRVWSLLLGVDRLKLEQIGVYEVSLRYFFTEFTKATNAYSTDGISKYRLSIYTD